MDSKNSYLLVLSFECFETHLFKDLPFFRSTALPAFYPEQVVLFVVHRRIVYTCIDVTCRSYCTGYTTLRTCINNVSLANVGMRIRLTFILSSCSWCCRSLGCTVT